MDVVHVRFEELARPRACDPAGLALEVGEPCIVESDHGPMFGTVARVALPNPLVPPGTPLPKVMRRATREDEEAYARKTSIERDARQFCLDRIAERGIAMKLGVVERQIDGKRMTFHFTSEGRVDFRDLVRDLSSRFHTRIEMRQIGDREDAGMKGGCGPCGLSLCCSTFLKGFEPISIKMAKSQGLSLNPSKISGMCGRLMCCLKYEYDPTARDKGKKGAPPESVEPASGEGAAPQP